MTTSELITPPRALSPPQPRSDAGRNARAAASSDRTVREMLAETLALVEVVPVAGPPAILLAGPLVLFALTVAGAFACACTLVVLLVGAAALAGVIGAILASPYLLVRRVRGRRSRQASRDAHAPQSVPLEWRRVVA
jgi:hypothetical protein